MTFFGFSILKAIYSITIIALPLLLWQLNLPLKIKFSIIILLPVIVLIDLAQEIELIGILKANISNPPKTKGWIFITALSFILCFAFLFINPYLAVSVFCAGILYAKTSKLKSIKELKDILDYQNKDKNLTDKNEI